MGVPGPPENVRAVKISSPPVAGTKMCRTRCAGQDMCSTGRATTHNEIGPHRDVRCGPPGPEALRSPDLASWFSLVTEPRYAAAFRRSWS